MCSIIIHFIGSLFTAAILAKLNGADACQVLSRSAWLEYMVHVPGVSTLQKASSLGWGLGKKDKNPSS